MTRNERKEAVLAEFAECFPEMKPADLSVILEAEMNRKYWEEPTQAYVRLEAMVKGALENTVTVDECCRYRGLLEEMDRLFLMTEDEGRPREGFDEDIANIKEPGTRLFLYFPWDETGIVFEMADGCSPDLNDLFQGYDRYIKYDVFRCSKEEFTGFAAGDTSLTPVSRNMWLYSGRYVADRPFGDVLYDIIQDTFNDCPMVEDVCWKEAV